MTKHKLIIPENRTPEWERKFIENYWMGLGDTTLIKVDNPFFRRSTYDIENPHVFVLDLMRRPENFFFTCKHLLNKTMPPMQLAILRELWLRPFPMLIGSRGMGKCAKGDTLIMTGSGFSTLVDLVGDAPIGEKVPKNEVILGENGFKNVEYAWNNGEGETRKIATRYGFELEGTPNHPVRVVANGQIAWRELKDLKVGDRIPIDRSLEWYEPSVNLPDDVAYLFGLLVGDGGYTVRGRVGFTSGDPELPAVASKVTETLWGKPFRKQAAKYQYVLCGTAIWDELFQKYGFNSSVCGEKNFPKSVLGASRSAVAAFIQGLMDTDGSITEKTGQVQYASKSERLVRTLQFVLTRFGIIARVRRRLNKKYQRTYFYLEISGSSLKRFAAEIGFRLGRKQEKLLRVCQRETNSNTDKIPHELALNTILALRDKWAAIRPAGNHGYDYTRGLLSPSRLKAYETTYEHLGKVLWQTCEKLSGSDEWQTLFRVLEQHYFYDTVTSVEEGRCVTYDVHVPSDHSFISNGFVSHNSFLLAMYVMLRALFEQGRKIVIVGAAFRQAKVVFDYCQEIWENGPVLQDIVGYDKRNGPRRDVDRCTLRMGESLIIALPMGDGSKIRGQRASIVVSEEFASTPINIFETVIRGFGAVSNSPIEKLQAESRNDAIKALGLWLPEHEAAEQGKPMGNQTIISGTAYYAFNHFYDYWKRYKAIIESRGDFDKLANALGGPDKVDKNIDWRDYCIIRVPVTMIPRGFMDEKQIAQAKATVHCGIFEMEYGACFATDSNGFFKRSLVESCVVGKLSNVISHPSCGEIHFTATVKGNPDHIHVMAIDPASERDNFSIIILEVWPDHRRIVYCWTTTRQRHKAKLKAGLAEEHDFYGYTARKIRELSRCFPCSRIAIDSQGGGVGVLEALSDPDKLRGGEQPWYPVVDRDKPAITDGFPGQHFIELISFANANWVRDANTGLRKDFEDKALLFPEFDPALMVLAMEEDKASGRVKADQDGSIDQLFDTLEGCMLEIEELKDELATIVHSQTGTSMRDRWDTPETKSEGGKKGRMRKDRYSALLMANMVARTIQRAPPEPQYRPMGGFANQLSGGDRQGKMWVGPSWWTEGANVAGVAVRKTER